MTGTSGTRVELVGLRDTIRQLEALGIKARTEIRVAARAGAALVAEGARARTPVGGGASSPNDDHPGLLQDSIKAGGGAFSAYVSVGNPGNESGLYAAPIHWGWPSHGIAPSPFLYESLDARRAEIIGLFEHRIAALCNGVRGGSDVTVR